MASAEMSRTIALVNAGAAYALGDVAASLTQANSIADAQEGLTDSLAQAEAHVCAQQCGSRNTGSKGNLGSRCSTVDWASAGCDSFPVRDEFRCYRIKKLYCERHIRCCNGRRIDLRGNSECS